MKYQLNPVEQPRAAQSDTLVTVVSQAAAVLSLHTVFHHAHCAMQDVQLDWFAVDVMGMGLCVPSFHCDTDTADFYSK